MLRFLAKITFAPLFILHPNIMRQLSIFTLSIFAAFAGHSYAQNAGIGNNSVMISTTNEGNVVWSANIDGQSRKGYIDNQTLHTCKQDAANDDVIIPTTTFVYPSQSTDVLFFSGDGENTYSVTILDETGNVVATKQSKEDQSMDISDFNNGTYTLIIKRGEKGKAYTRKLIKE